MATAKSQDQRGRREGYRSGLEALTAEWLESVGVDARYEDPSSIITYTKPAKTSRYTPDFVLPNGIIIETKGRFITADRQKHLLIKEQRPEEDIRFIFSNPNSRISKTSRTTYGMWCEKHDFQYAKAPTQKQIQDGAPLIPLEWINEPCKRRS